MATNQPKKSKKKALLITALCILVILVGIPSFLNIFYGEDIVAPNDAYLTLQPTSLPDAENMFVELNELANTTLHTPEGINFVNTFLESDTWDDALADEVFTQNAAALELWEQAAQKNNYLNPTFADPTTYAINDPLIISHGSWRVANRIALAQAIWYAHTGKIQLAIDQALLSIKIGDTIIASERTLIGYLVGLAIKDSGLDALQKIITMPGVIIPDTQILATTLAQYNRKNNGDFFKAEYFVSQQVFHQIAAGNSDFIDHSATDLAAHNNFYFKPNVTISYLAQDYKQLIIELHAPCKQYPHHVQHTNFATDSIADYFKLLFTENAIGKMLATLPYASLTNVIEKTCELETKHTTTIDLINQ